MCTNPNILNKETGTTATAWKVLPWVMGLMVLGVCAAISFWWAKRSHGPNKPSPYPIDELGSEARHPMIPTIRDMIELTTSGSGSGMYLILFAKYSLFIYTTQHINNI